MKKSLLAAGALAALGGLGFAGSAHAVWAIGNAANADAVTLSAESNTGVGHIMVTPYFSAGDSNSTLLTIVNTDTTNGKAVKVRFRGAANSDDILDFTVLLSPGDVWSAAVSQGANGVSNLVTPDTSCVLPGIPTVASGGQDFMTSRLDPALSGEGLNAHTREGYVEWLNMADISPEAKKGWTIDKETVTLFDAIKHKDNVAPCNAVVMKWLMDPKTPLDEEAAAEWGLVAPSGKLMGNWTIFNTANVTSYAGANAAIVALGENGGSTSARLFFSPQIGPSDPTFAPNGYYTGGAGPKGETADPLVAAGVLTLQPFDLPDLSTPYVDDGVWTARNQADLLSYSFAATRLMNEWTAGVDNGTQFSTDWVFSQPTRRYHAAMDYIGPDVTKPTPTGVFSGHNFYPKEQMIVRSAGPNGMYGKVLCLNDNQLVPTIFNREEGQVDPVFQGDWSPAPAAKAIGFCGEVATLTFGTDQSVALNARLTTTQVNGLPAGGAGWMSVGMNGVGGNGLPVIGFAANTFSGSNGSNTGNYGDAIGHRYERPTGFHDATPVVETSMAAK